jgi:hypothetical protein
MMEDETSILRISEYLDTYIKAMQIAQYVGTFELCPAPRLPHYVFPPVMAVITATSFGKPY